MSRPLLLHVEDDADDALLIGLALEQASGGSPIRVVENGQEAARYLQGKEPYSPRHEHPLPGLILLDLNTPVMSGHDFLRWLNGQRVLKRIPVVVLTSSDSSSDIAAAFDAGANAYLVKPLDHTRMTEMVRVMYQFWFDWNSREA